MAARPPQFDETAGTWGTYRVRLEAYFEGHGITDAAKRRALLVSSLSDNVVRILQGRCQSASINSLSYADVVGYLEEHYDPQANEIAASYSFFVRKQEEGEKVQDFVAELRRLAKQCKFGDTLDRMLRDRIVCGIRDDEARRVLLTRKKLSREEAEEFVIASEMADNNVRAMGTAPQDSAGGTHFVQGRRGNRRPPRQETSGANRRAWCWRCDANHSEDDCRHRKTICHRCGTKGHLARVCKYSRPSQPGAYALADINTEEESGEEMLHALVSHSTANKDTTPPIERDLLWEDRKLRMILDTGSPVSVIPESAFKRHRKRWPALETTPLRLSCFLGPLPVVGKITMSVQYGQTQVRSSLIVVNCPGPLLCGRNTLRAFYDAGAPLLETGAPFGVNMVQAGAEGQDLLEEFADIFEEKLGCCQGPPVKLYRKEDARPRFCKARPVPYALRDKVSAEINRLEKDGVLSPVSVSEWATPVVPVAKKNGEIRLCGDFKLTLPLDEEARKMTVLSTHQGLYCYNRLAFGIASAPALFQRRIESLLQGLPRVQVYLDDIVIAEKKHDTSTLRQVLQRLRENGLKLNRAKCRIREKQVSFLGHRIDAQGLHPERTNLEAVTEAPRPTSVSQLKSFLGFVTYYAKFLPNLSTTLAPLYRLLAKGAQWQWDGDQERAFRKTKQAMAEAKFLVHYNPRQQLRLECDASPGGLGAVLSHRMHGKDYPIAFRSRTLTKAERNYSQLEKEALALVFGVTKFRDYLFGNRFTLVTDHKPLTALFHPERAIPQMAAARVQRWALLLAAYQYDLEYRKGNQNGNADALSRLPLPAQEEGSSEVLTEYVLYTRGWDDQPMSAQQMATLTTRDSLLRQVKAWIYAGWPSHLRPEQHQFLPYFSRRSTPMKEGKSPAELLLGFRPRTRLTGFFSRAEEALHSVVEPQAPATTPPPFSPGMPVWSRQFQPRRRWLPGTVVSSEGRRMVTLRTPDGQQRRHLDQLRPRDASGSPEGADKARRVAGRSEVGARPPSTDEREVATNGDPEVTPTADPVPLRRSTRLRKPPDRLNL
ncbi:retrovirus-related Pol polyprotein from transposon 17.6 [Ixodes scapularis]